MAKAKTTDELIVEKLDYILRVLSIQVAPDLSLSERARILKTAGLDIRTIAEILNTSPNTIRIVTARPAQPRKGKP
jgi:hypothetical protein